MKYIQVLERALELLETISAEGSHAVRLKDLAQTTSLNTATVARILNTLKSRGYVEQIGRNEGYVLGAMLHRLAAKSQERLDLVPKLSPIVTNLAEQCGEVVVLASLSNYRRISLMEIESRHNIQVQMENTQRYNLYDSATGRVLLANLPENEFNKFIEMTGLPGDKWTDADSLDKLRNICTEIRSQNYYIKHDNDVISCASPIFESGHAIASIGLYLPEYRFDQQKERLLKLLTDAAAAMTLKLEE